MLAIKLETHQLSNLLALQILDSKYFFKGRNTAILKRNTYLLRCFLFTNLPLTPLPLGPVTWRFTWRALLRVRHSVSRAGVAETCAWVPTGQAADLHPVGATERLAPGSCSAGAGPTGGTNAFDLHSGPLPASWTLRSRTLVRIPALRACSLWFPQDPASGARGPGQVRGSGRDPRRSAGVSPGGTPSAGHRRTRRPKRVPRSLPAGLDRCGAGRGWGGNQTGVERAGAGLGLGRSVQGWAGLRMPGAGAGAGPGLGRGSAIGIPCTSPTTDQGPRTGSFSLFFCYELLDDSVKQLPQCLPIDKGALGT